MTDEKLRCLVIEGGTVYSPQPVGELDLICAEKRLASMGRADKKAWEQLGFEVESLDAKGCFVFPGIIDPHEHIVGGSGESGFASITPEIGCTEIVEGGITTVVGCLGVDTVTQNLLGLLGKVRTLNDQGVTAFCYSGGYDVPATTFTGSVRSDMLIIPDVIGAGEVAIADKRSTAPNLDELARLAHDAYVGGLLTNKAGVTHFHVGDRESRLQLIRQLVNEREIPPETLYPTHVERSEALMLEAIEHTKLGATVDVDTVEEDLPKWVRFYLDHQGHPDRLTVSSDAAINSPGTVWKQIRQCIREKVAPIEVLLPLVGANTARILKLKNKGLIRPGADADFVVVDQKSLEIRHVVARGRPLMKDGRLLGIPQSMKESNRRIHIDGQKAK
jgi:beta-aspartyl-dipeptidase (metallo-type)